VPIPNSTKMQQNLAGSALLRAPKYTFSVGADYRARLVEGWDSTLSLQGSYSSSFETATDYAPGGHQDAYWLLNAGVRVGPEGGNYEVALLGRNLTNTYYTLNTIGWSGSSAPNQYVGWFNRPREIVLQATVHW
jgi:iron complex outermembrane receptor protein